MYYFTNSFVAYTDFGFRKTIIT